ncbi:DUF3311 domain-containing protein [Neobacillus drentensis]|uniref:DUF3311 domain-containing protein n=1 Tax=Neobacillus drentensis TaxID=220684 RepID=UPI001F48D759|nr:DUF3311 domain-containing protein [Neobacillus drentensis]ULT57372.1 DUF3311 domain-containing protein [Neobacillus drentensis]
MKKWIALLTILPAIGSLTVVNKVEPYILGLPFIVFWSTLWLILTSVCLLVCNVIYDRKEQNNE